MSGILASEAGKNLKLGQSELVFICAMLYNLGKMLVICYFPEEYGEIKARMIHKGVSEERAAHSVLGISYNELGAAVSHSWNFPEIIARSMEGPPRGVIETPKTEQDVMRCLSSYAHELCHVVVSTEETERDQALADLAKRYQKSIPMPVNRMPEAVPKCLP